MLFLSWRTTICQTYTSCGVVSQLLTAAHSVTLPNKAREPVKSVISEHSAHHLTISAL